MYGTYVTFFFFSFISSYFMFSNMDLGFQFTFESYSAEDDDYEGYDYSLRGRLSAVRIVFLYKFVQEVSHSL